MIYNNICQSTHGTYIIRTHVVIHANIYILLNLINKLIMSSLQFDKFSESLHNKKYISITIPSYRDEIKLNL